MDNHKGALAFWADLGISGATCVHVDAHLDVSNFQVPEPGEIENADLNCGNFLYPGLTGGVIEHLIWVLPPHLFASSPSLLWWAIDELQNWMWLTVAEARSLHEVPHGVEGTLAGGRLTLCTVDRMPAIQPAGPLLVDIDVDYFFGPANEIWQTPFELHDRLGHLAPSAVTVASSVDGGYTPPERRYVGDITHLCFTGQRPQALDFWTALQAQQRLPEAPAWYRAACLALEAERAGEAYAGPLWDAAAAIEEGYRLRPLDVASFYLHRKDFDRCLAWTERVRGADDRLAARYLQGLVAFRREAYAHAATHFTELVDQAHVGGLLAAHLLEMGGKAQAAQGRDEEAMASFQAASQLAPQNASLWRQMAQAWRRLGNLEKAGRTWRRALAMAPDDLATLAARWDLAQLYVEQGQLLLARAELHQLIRQDDGTLGAKARLLSMKLERE